MRRILVAPLDWGLGHATRCMPVIREIQALGHVPVIAADGEAFNLLKDAFPTTEIIHLRGYRPVYPDDRGNMVWTMLWQSPAFIQRIFREHQALQTLIQKYALDAVISDNRYGLWSNKVPSVIITHQLFIKMPAFVKWMERPVRQLNRFFIEQFDECWVPDFADEENLSGALSHGQRLPCNTRFIGPLSRFADIQDDDAPHHVPDLLIVLSGPEPQRSLLEKEIIPEAASTGLNTLIIRGIPGKQERSQINDRIFCVCNMDSTQMFKTLKRAKFIVSRPGYTTIMDLAALGKKAIFIPTPGQTEQEYLAWRAEHTHVGVVQRQGNIHLQTALEKLKSIGSAPPPAQSLEYKSAIARFIDSLTR